MKTTRKAIFMSAALAGLLFQQSSVAVSTTTEVAVAVQSLSAPDADNRCRAARAMGDMGEKALSAYDLLFALALSEDLPKVRAAASAALGKIAKDKAVDQLIGELRTNSIASVREHVADALMEPQLQDPRAAIPLFEALRDENQQVRGRAGIALQFYKGDELGALLLTTLTNKGDRARTWAPWLLGRMKYQPAVQTLITLLSDEDVAFRQSVIAALRDLQAKQAVSALIAVAKADTNDEVRTRAIQLLGELGSSEANKILMTLMSDPNPEVRASAIGSLGLLGVDEAKQPLREILRKGTGRERLAALGALCHLKDTNTVEIIIEVLNTGDKVLTPYLIQGLIEFHATNVVGRLQEHEDETIRAAASNALNRIERKRNHPTTSRTVP